MATDTTIQVSGGVAAAAARPGSGSPSAALAGAARL